MRCADLENYEKTHDSQECLSVRTHCVRILNQSSSVSSPIDYIIVALPSIPLPLLEALPSIESLYIYCIEGANMAPRLTHCSNSYYSHTVRNDCEISTNIGCPPTDKVSEWHNRSLTCWTAAFYWCACKHYSNILKCFKYLKVFILLSTTVCSNSETKSGM